jgi:hypothetical protein
VVALHRLVVFLAVYSLYIGGGYFSPDTPEIKKLHEVQTYDGQIADKAGLAVFKEGPGAEALSNTLALFVRLKPHAPSGKTKMGLFIRLGPVDETGPFLLPIMSVA